MAAWGETSPPRPPLGGMRKGGQSPCSAGCFRAWRLCVKNWDTEPVAGAFRRVLGLLRCAANQPARREPGTSDDEAGRIGGARDPELQQEPGRSPVRSPAAGPRSSPARKRARQARVIELDPKYCDGIVRRWFEARRLRRDYSSFAFGFASALSSKFMVFILR